MSNYQKPLYEMTEEEKLEARVALLKQCLEPQLCGVAEEMFSEYIQNEKAKLSEIIKLKEIRSVSHPIPLPLNMEIR